MNDAKEQVVAPLLLTVCPEQQGEQQGSPLFNFSIKEVSRNQLWFALRLLV